MEIGIRQLRDSLSSQLRAVASGETVIVTDHGRPIARIVSIGGSSSFERLVAAGVIVPPPAAKDEAPHALNVGMLLSDLIDEQRR